MFKININKLFNLLLFILFLPSLSFAQISFSEIMYDPEGTDSGYEWVEIKNNSGSNQNFKDWKFCEGKTSTTCHGIKSENNSNLDLPANSFAIITDDRDKFLEKNNFIGLVLVSTGFSLLNSEGEKLELKNSSGNIEDFVRYNPESGGDNGNTLCLIGDIWKDCKNTAGEENIEILANGHNSTNTPSSDNNFIPSTYIEFTDIVNGKKRIKAEIDEFSTAVAGARSSFYGRTYGLTDNEIYSAEYFWNMGDGQKEYGKKINHTYEFPGEYIISLTTKVGKFTGNHKRKIKVIAPDISFTNIDFEKNIIGLQNKSNEILNLGGWIIMVDGDKFTLPEDTFIQNKGKILFSNKIMGFTDFERENRIFLLFPNEIKFLEYKVKKDNITLYEKDNAQKVNKEDSSNYLKVKVKSTKPRVIISLLDVKAEEKQKIIHVQKKITEEIGGAKIKKDNKSNSQQASIFTSFDNANIIYIDNLDKNFIKNNYYHFIFISILFILVGIMILFRLFTKSDDINKEENKIEAEVLKYNISEIKD